MKNRFKKALDNQKGEPSLKIMLKKPTPKFNVILKKQPTILPDKEDVTT